MEFFHKRHHTFPEEKYHATISHFCQSLCPVDFVVKFFLNTLFNMRMDKKSQDCRKIVHKNVRMKILEYGFDTFSAERYYGFLCIFKVNTNKTQGYGLDG